MTQSSDVVWHDSMINGEKRAEQKAQRPCLIWFTGLSGSGKSTIANAVEARLFELGAHSYLLDGDNVRHGLCGDLGFSDADRVENIRRVTEVSKLMLDAGLITLTAFISPFTRERNFAREKLAEGEFIEVYVNTPLEVCEQRDPKGLYQKARKGEIANFTGISSEYQAPISPEIELDTRALSPEQAADKVIAYLLQNAYLGGADA